MTELIWGGKYDEKGELKPVDRTILPFQVVETVNESKADREKAQRDLFTKQAYDSEWRNILIWGDSIEIVPQASPPASSSPERTPTLKQKPFTRTMNPAPIRFSSRLLTYLGTIRRRCWK